MKVFVSYHYTIYYQEGHEFKGFGNDFLEIERKIQGREDIEIIENELEWRLESGDQIKDVMAFVSNFQYI
jgi:hypothetical protein